MPPVAGVRLPPLGFVGSPFGDQFSGPAKILVNPHLMEIRSPIPVRTRKPGRPFFGKHNSNAFTSPGAPPPFPSCARRAEDRRVGVHRQHTGGGKYLQVPCAAGGSPSTLGILQCISHLDGSEEATHV